MKIFWVLLDFPALFYTLTLLKLLIFCLPMELICAGLTTGTILFFSSRWLMLPVFPSKYLSFNSCWGVTGRVAALPILEEELLLWLRGCYC